MTQSGEEEKGPFPAKKLKPIAKSSKNEEIALNKEL